ncbi:sporulation protein YqfC [Alteribacillus persepolensis]|uniref:Sporulation protein YqfC n=1 Tax=Alteribacillus persepolensis TaxID=568899 RepID=A0A1G8CQ69_9BACI|nr:sporulation protein YqfC [Alteribacillus persepolensis]SDH47681.1 sporulation protein YqfC [Alteribacillus persepolensis]
MFDRFKQNAKYWVTGKMNLPEDVLLDVPRLTMIGQLHLHVENHRGVLHFSKELVRLKLTYGELAIKGHDFVIKTILPNELLLEGTIDEVSYLNDKEAGGIHE